jgi:hypothetical protein
MIRGWRSVLIVTAAGWGAALACAYWGLQRAALCPARRWG